MMLILVAYASRYGSTRQIGEQIARTLRSDEEIAEFREKIRPRGHRVFFGALDRHKLRFVDRLVARMPAFPRSEGDFRDWQDIDGWTHEIMCELAPI